MKLLESTKKKPIHTSSANLNRINRFTPIQQLSALDSGIVCLRIVLNYFHRDAPLEKLRVLSSFYFKGSTLFGLVQAGRIMGLYGKGYKADIEFLQKCQSPCLLQIHKDDNPNHFIVFCGYDDTNKKIKIIDPAEYGIKSYSLNQIQELWLSKCLLLFTNPNETKLIKEGNTGLLIKLVKENLNLLLAIIGFGFLIVIINLTLPFFIQQLIDNFLLAQTIQVSYINLTLLTLLLFIWISIKYVYKFFILRMSHEVYSSVDDNFSSALEFTPSLFFKYKRTGEIIERYNSVNQVLKKVPRLISRSVIDVLMFLVSLLTLFIYNGKIGFVALVILPLFYFIAKAYHLKTIKSLRKELDAYRKVGNEYENTISNYEVNFNNSKITKGLFNLYLKDKFISHQLSISQLYKIDTLIFFAMSLVIVVGTWEITNENLSIGRFIASAIIVMMMVKSIRSLILNNKFIQEVKIEFERLYDYTTSSFDFKKDENRSKRKISSFENLIIKDLKFHFNPKKIILENINLTVRRGELIVLVGNCGSGKTTLMQIILERSKLVSGAIEVNSINFENLSMLDWRRQIAIVPEQVRFVKGTVIKNILMGEELQNHHKLEAFFTCYGFDKYFDNFPNGINTILGTNKSYISKGQQQIVALARALWKKPTLLLLDEPMQNLDENSERFFIEVLKKVKCKMGVILFASRLPQVNYATRVYFLEKGITRLMNDKILENSSK